MLRYLAIRVPLQLGMHIFIAGYDNPEPRNVVGDKCAMSGWVTALSNKRRSSENRDEIPAKKQVLYRFTIYIVVTFNVPILLPLRSNEVCFRPL